MCFLTLYWKQAANKTQTGTKNRFQQKFKLIINITCNQMFQKCAYFSRIWEKISQNFSRLCEDMYLIVQLRLHFTCLNIWDVHREICLLDEFFEYNCCWFSVFSWFFHTFGFLVIGFSLILISNFKFSTFVSFHLSIR